jgi:hypothetical protein
MSLDWTVCVAVSTVQCEEVAVIAVHKWCGWLHMFEAWAMSVAQRDVSTLTQHYISTLTQQQS